jgi:hypothetical protein
MQPFAPRPITFLGVLQHGGWRLKHYGIVSGDATLDQAVFAAGHPLVLGALPQPAVTPERDGLGFLISHQARSLSYAVLCWWDRENELPIRVFVRQRDGSPWRPAQGSESVCVWDLQVICFERDVYVGTVMASGGGGAEAYLAKRRATGS